VATDEFEVEAEGARLPEPPLPGFEHINRYWDSTHHMFAAKILPGEFYVTRAKEIIVTVLGSCISACVRDPVTGVGGMNHFMLPRSQHESHGSWAGSEGKDHSLRYGDFAMKRLLNEILKNGGRRENLEIKIFGGGRIIEDMSDVGSRNIAFIQKYIRDTGLRLLSDDIGGIYPRKVYYFPDEGNVRVKKLHTLHNNTIIDREVQYRARLEQDDADVV
jgi:chemotaxis protein CheD